MAESKDFLSDAIFDVIRDSFRYDVCLKNTSWFGCGGLAEVMFRPKNIVELRHFLQNFPFKEKITILGACSNLIIRDGGISGVVIKLGRGFADMELLDGMVVAGGAALDANVANFCADEGFSGLEFLSGIPGSIGGNIRMNAGCYGDSIADVLVRFEVMDYFGNNIVYDRKDVEFIYRHNPLPENLIFTKGFFSCVDGDATLIREKIKSIQIQRSESQPLGTKTSGSTFTNPEANSAWRLIDSCGLRGLNLGGAMVSEKHCNFLINTGNATALELESLGELLRSQVMQKHGILLDWEIKRIGNFR